MFNNEYYQQLDGVPMVPQSDQRLLIFALFYMKLFDCTTVLWILNLTRIGDILMIIFLLFENAQGGNFKQYLNSQHVHIRFPSGIEVYISLSLLDIKIVGQLVYKTDSKFIKLVYRRPTFKEVFTNFERFIPKLFKSFNPKD